MCTFELRAKGLESCSTLTVARSWSSGLHDLSATSEPIRLTFSGKNGFPIISPDGQQVAYQSDRDGDLAIFIQRADGSGQAERMTKPEKGDKHVPESWSPDGKQISFSVITGATSSLWTLSLADKKTTQFGAGQTSSGEPIGSVFSPDGGWIAYHSARRPPGAGPSPANSGVFVEAVPANGTFHQALKSTSTSIRSGRRMAKSSSTCHWPHRASLPPSA